MLTSKEAFNSWLGACMHGCVGDHINEMAGNTTAPIVDEKIQLSWFDNSDWNALRSYKGRFYKSASYALICEAPEDIVKNYLYYCAPISDGQQIALIKRDIRNQTYLSWEYFKAFRACETAQRLIRDYDSQLWQRVVIVNYGWEWEFEKKFGSLHNWQQKLQAHYDKLTTCEFEDIWNILRAIE